MANAFAGVFGSIAFVCVAAAIVSGKLFPLGAGLVALFVLGSLFSKGK